MMLRPRAVFAAVLLLAAPVHAESAGYLYRVPLSDQPGTGVMHTDLAPGEATLSRPRDPGSVVEAPSTGDRMEVVLSDRCGDPSWRASLVGQDAAAAVAAVRARGVSARVFEAGEAVTGDYALHRLNIEIDAAGKVAAAFCG